VHTLSKFFEDDDQFDFDRVGWAPARADAPWWSCQTEAPQDWPAQRARRVVSCGAEDATGWQRCAPTMRCAPTFKPRISKCSGCCPPKRGQASRVTGLRITPRTLAATATMRQ